MTDALSPRDGELLAAYLVDDLEPAEAAELEARLAEEPALAARLEQTREALETLARVDEAEPPPGYSDRLRARLEEARAAESATDTASAEPRPQPASLDAARTARHDRWRRRWPSLGAVAAGVIGIAVLGALAVSTINGPTADMDMAEEPVDEAVDDSADEPATLAEPEAEMDMPEDLDDGAQWTEEFSDDEPVDAEELPRVAAPTEPVVVDSEVVLDDPEAVAAHFADSAAHGLLGTPLADAEDLASGFGVAVQRSPELASGAAPDACLHIVGENDQPIVVAQVETVVYADEPALAYVVATARSGSAALDRVEVWIVEPVGCATRLFIDLSP